MSEPGVSAPEPGTEAPPKPAPIRRMLGLVTRPRRRRVDLIVALLLAVLGFGLAVQVRSTQNEGVLTSARPEDLVQILDELRNRGDRLRDEVASLQETQRQLSSGSGAASSALDEARRRTQVLGVLAGTLPARGPGVQMTITDPTAQVSASLLLDAMEELRNAGAEAMQIEGTGTNGRRVAVRAVASTALVDQQGGIRVDTVSLRAPYRFVVVGDPSTLAGAMAIPGGVEDTVRQQGGTVEVARSEDVRVTALHPLTPPRYARPQ